ncbi:MAG: hypothetical protein HC869_23095 [Rhodospirillales bacterium]|nr:hypothetical protein [Rhodospirillales bacterium]
MAKLDGTSVLLLEDEYLIALDAETNPQRARRATSRDRLRTLSEAVDRARDRHFDVALLDVNVNGQMSFGLAQSLRGARRSGGIYHGLRAQGPRTRHRRRVLRQQTVHQRTLATGALRRIGEQPDSCLLRKNPEKPRETQRNSEKNQKFRGNSSPRARRPLRNRLHPCSGTTRRRRGPPAMYGDSLATLCLKSEPITTNTAAAFD